MIITPEGQIAATLIPLALALFALFRWLDSKFDRVNDKFDRVNDRFDRVNDKFDRVDDQFNSVRNDTKVDIQNLDKKIERSDSKLSGEIKEVRQASETAHKEIIGRQGKMETTLATHTERFNTVQAQIKCVEDKVDSLSSKSS